MYKEDLQHLEYLRKMLAELLEKKSSPYLSTAEQVQVRAASEALKRSVELLQSQVYA